MKRILTYEITKEQKSIRDFLQEQRYPHSVILQLKRTENSVLVRGEWLHLYEPLHVGDVLEIYLEEKESSKNIVPRRFGDLMGTQEKLPIVYEDEDVLVINKPAGLPIHPSQNHYEDSLANAVMAYYAEQDIPFVFRCINRLDRNTSGLTLIAKHMLSGAILSEDVKRRDIHRTYLAIVGNAPAFPEKKGTVDAPIARKDGSTILREVNEEMGDRAVTHYEVEKTWKTGDSSLALLRLQLETGRTHQIRVHMSHIGHPLVGDDLYGGNLNGDIISSQIFRHALHSYELEFTHPISGKVLKFQADLPEDMMQLLPTEE